ncbi:MAG: ubiquinol oxidase subunit II [Reyranella sp.]|nr:ubiquinol oxidase subunit II [Reyranella sp.]
MGLVYRLLRGAAPAGAALFAGGCDLRHSAVLDPKGPIALAQRDLLFDAFFVMLVVVVPVIVLTLWFAWRYRAGNTAATYAPKWSKSPRLEAFVWLVPSLIVVAVAVLVWRSTHKLDPYRPIASAQPPLEVQVVAQDWKWLFIYPEQGVATVNQLAFPSGRPLSLRITSDTVMNAFYVPQLAGQIYAMAGMQTRLQLLADAPGSFVGRNSMYSGDGFSDQFFEVVALAPADFDAWVVKVRQAPARLDAKSYPALAAKSQRHPVTFYSAVEPGLYDSIIAKYAHSGHAQPAAARR